MNDQNKTLIIISPGFPDNEADTTCLPAQQVFIKTLNEIYPGLTIIILTLIYPYTKKKYQWNKNLVISFNGKSYWKIFRPVLWLEVYLKLQKIQRSNRILGVLTFWCGECALIGHYFSRKFKNNHRIWILGQDAKKENHFVKWINPSPDELIALSDFLKEEFHKNHHIRPSHTITNGIKSSFFSPKNPDTRQIDIFGAGSLIPLKQYDVFIDIIAALKKHFPAIKAVLCGKGPEYDRLLNKIIALNLQSNITLMGELSHPEVLELMQKSKILLHPSVYEGYSTVCLEALYAGCHIVSIASPEKNLHDHWHVTNSEEQMVSMCLSLLSSSTVNFSPVLIHSMEDSAKKIMQLFNYSGQTDK